MSIHSEYGHYRASHRPLVSPAPPVGLRTSTGGRLWLGRLPARPRVTAQAAASSLGIELALGPIGDAHAEIESAFEAFARTSNGGLLLPPDTNTNTHRDL